MKRFFLILILALLSFSSTEAETSREKRAPIWVYLETVPGSLTAEQLKSKIPPIQELNNMARFIMGGMVYGWKFSYTPSDLTRKVTEYFELSPIKEIETGDPRLSISELTPEYPRLSCTAIFTLDDSVKRWELYWSSVLFKSANGRGYAERTEEVEGIHKAYADAVRDAVRSYARKLEKNKPKEIRGEVLLRDEPRLFTDGGQFVADIKVFINMQELIPYTTF